MLWIVLWVALGFCCLLLASLWAGQRALLFPAPRIAREPAASPGALRHRVRLAGGAELPALSWPAPAGSPTLVYYHGNGEQLADLVAFGEAFHEAGLGFFTAEYPGYALARASGPPTEARLYEGAEAALDFLQSDLGVPVEHTVLIGHSLGSGVATEMAARGRCGRLVLLSPFTSIGDMAARLFFWLPARHLVRDPFDNLGKAPRVSMPVLVVHGARDALIPAEMGERLGAAFDRGRVEIIAGAGHNDLLSDYDDAIMPLVVAFARPAEVRR
jgi:uncharacterized protein